MKRKQGHAGPRSSTKVGQAQRRHPPSQADAAGFLRDGRPGEAAAVLRQIIAADPESWQALHLLGLTAYRQGKREEAAGILRRCLEVKPDLAEAHSDLGAILKELGQLEEARRACNSAITLKPAFFPAYTNLGNVLKALGRLDDAVAAYQQALALDPNCGEAHANLGTVLVMQGKAEEALGHCRRAAALAPDIGEVHVVLGHALRHAGKVEEALAAYRRAMDIKPAYAPVYSDLACLLQETGQYEAALHAHEQALMLQPDYAEAHNNIGLTLKRLGRYAEAEGHYRKAIALKPGYAEAYSNLGAVLDRTGRREEAASAYRQAISLRPGDMQPYLNLAGSLWERGQLTEAGAAYRQALAIDPDHPGALIDDYNLRRHACEWEGLAAIEERILRDTYRAGRRVQPFSLLNIPCRPEEHLLCARLWAKGLPRVIEKPFEHAQPRKAGGGRLRIGYLSADFYSHATASLITELFERHDRGRFEISGYCFSRDDHSDARQRIIGAFDRFAVIGALSHADAARRIHHDGIDILIDLKGYTAEARTEILVCRPAPIQVNYLGYPGTMGADFIDYIIADPFILPMDQAGFYDEKIVHLPHCYQPNDTKRAIASETPSRAACGLPDTGFVFCCFNNTYKISAERFGLWMRLLGSVPGSVLWLLEANSLVRDNLRREAREHGVDPARLVFAPKMDLPKHLARHRLADLFLDTAPIGAHTTASDALWAGLPVLTCAGDALVSRACGSLLHAVGLPELVTQSPEDYEAAALRLAHDPAALGGLRERLERNRLTSPLFAIGQYARDLESAYDHMADLRSAGLSPHAFAVSDIGTEPLAPAAAMPEVAEAVPAARAQAVARTKPSARIAYEACPLCGSKNIARYREADCTQHPCYCADLPPTMTWSRCDACGHVFTAGYFSRQAADAIFGKTLPHQRVGHDVEAQRAVSARIVEHIITHVPRTPPRPKVKEPQAQAVPGGAPNGVCGDWLDVGFGNASLVFTAQEWGFHAVGVDLRRDNVHALATLGYEAYCSSVEDLGFPGRFGVISMADVLEHVPFPKTALTAAYSLLRPQGVLFLSMPNMDTIVWRILDASRSNPYWGEIEHYHNFSRARLYALLEEQGFSLLAYHISERYRACMEVIAVRR